MPNPSVSAAADCFEVTRRKFLACASLSAAGLLIGCATNPVTGQSQLMLMSETQEIQVDREQSPHQFSSDYGAVQDAALNAYVDRTGKRLAARTHRPQMPYSFRVVNATYVNAYAFPGGSIAATRGILLALDNEAELSALLGHELGHVNARHTAQQMSKGMLTQAVVGGISALAGTQSAAYGELASQLGMMGAGALLASYSRDNEREADALGMGYMAGAGYSAEGFVGLMEMLRDLSRQKPNAIEMMFATHPMSDERYRSAVAEARGPYRYTETAPLHRERFMDHTADLRTMKNAIEAMQRGEEEMAGRRYAEAETFFKKALRQAPADYACLVMMAKCQLAQKKNAQALQYAEAAKQAYPQEAQAYHLSGFSKIRAGNFTSALADFVDYERRLPGNPNTIFYTGLALDGMHRTKDAANQYARYLQIVRQGDQAAYAHQRLTGWGYK